MLQLAPGDEVAGYALIRYRLPVDAVLIVFAGWRSLIWGHVYPGVAFRRDLGIRVWNSSGRIPSSSNPARSENAHPFHRPFRAHADTGAALRQAGDGESTRFACGLGGIAQERRFANSANLVKISGITTQVASGALYLLGINHVAPFPGCRQRRLGAAAGRWARSRSIHRGWRSRT